MAAVNTLTTIDLATNLPVVLAVSVGRLTQFRSRMLYLGWDCQWRRDIGPLGRRDRVPLT